MNREAIDSTYFYMILFSFFIFGSTILIYFGQYTEPQHTLTYLITTIILSPIMEELTYRILPLALGPLLLVSFQDSMRTKLKNIILLILFLFISLAWVFDFIVKNYISANNFLMIFLVGIFIFAIELLYSVFLTPKLHKKGFLIIIILFSLIWALGHFSYGILYPILVFIFGFMIGYYYYNRLNVVNWKDLEGKEITRNVITFSIVIILLHAINNASTNLIVGNNPVLNNIFQNILLLIVFYITFRLTIKPNKILRKDGN